MTTQEFTSWLDGKLTDLGTDASVFSPYITSILEGEDEGEEEKEEGITAILSDVLDREDLINSVLKEIQDRWKKHLSKSAVVNEAPKEPKLEIDDQLHKIMEQKMSNFSVQKKEATAEEKKLKAAILAGYATVDGTDDEDEEDDDEDLGSNANVKAVQEAQAEWKEAQKQSAMAKKEKDKQDRENQKKQAEDRKKKAQDKAAKGERRSGR